MAKDTITPPPAAIEYPAASDFSAAPPAFDVGPTIGTPIGVDLEKYAIALVDLTDKPARIATARHTLRQKGYAPIKSKVEVVGWLNAEVWVLPREKHNERIAARYNYLIDKVQRGLLSDSALRTPHVELTGRDGIAIPMRR